MPSLREKLDQERAAKESAKQEQILTQQEQESAALKQQLDDLVSKRAALAKIKEASVRAESGVKEARSKLKTEGNVLRELHKESVDEDTGKASLPKPTELIRDSEFAEADEVIGYKNAGEEFKLSLRERKNVQKQLTELGIGNAATISQSELEKELQERSSALESEARAFVLEHPDVDPEMAAKIREEIIVETANRVGSVIDSRVDPIISNPESSLAFKKRIGKKGETLTSALQDARRAFTNDIELRTRIMRSLAKGFPDRENITEFDTEALELMLARQTITRFAEAQPDKYYFIDKLAEAYYKDANSEATEGEVPADKTAAVERMVQEARDSGIFRPIAERTIKEYQAVSEFKKLPGEISNAKDELRKNERDNERDRTTQDSRFSEVRSLERNKSLSEQAQQNAALLIRELPTIREQFDLNRPNQIQLTNYTYGDSGFSVSIDQKTVLETKQKNEEAEREIRTINTLIRSAQEERLPAIDIGGGARKRKEKKIQDLTADRKQKQDEIDSRNREINRMGRDAESFQRTLQNKLGPYLSSVRASGFHAGTVAELFDALERGSLRAQVESGREQEKLATEIEAKNEELAEITARIGEFGPKQERLRMKIATLELRLREAQNTVQQAGYLSAIQGGLL